VEGIELLGGIGSGVLQDDFLASQGKRGVRVNKRVAIGK
jgi:hypothetical protein